MKNERFKKVAGQARALATRAVGQRTDQLRPWMLELKGLLEMYFAGGKLDPSIQEAASDPRELGALIRDSEWLVQRTNSINVTLLPDVRDRLQSVATALDKMADGGSTGRKEEAPLGERGPADAARFKEWRMVGGRLGHGGQGEVTLVRHAQTLERGALKQMTGNRSLTEKGRERFLREIEAFRRVEHPFVVTVLDAGEFPAPYLVTEVAAFGSLHDNRSALVGDAWRALRLTRSVALGLAAAHEQNIVHRDIKPKNILLESLDHPLVADFGIAHFADKDTLTSMGSHPGAFKFAPPEYEFDEEPTPAFDVFSLGAVLHYMLVGAEPKRPYRSNDQLPAVGGSGAGGARLSVVDELIAKMTAKDRADRFQTMTEVVAAVDHVLERLFGRAMGGLVACSCEAGKFRELGIVVLGSGTEINVYPDAKQNHGAYGFGQLSPRLEMCSACGALRLRAAEKPPR